MAEQETNVSFDPQSMELEGSKLKLDKLVHATNVCKLLPKEAVQRIGMAALDGYNQDISSRRQWEERYAQAMELALQVVKQKTFPWPGAANVKFPLVTVAALQYQARAYPALISGTDLVKCKVYGQDSDGSKSELANRLASHMTWQNLEQDDDYEPEMDKLLLVQPILGCAFKKRVFDPVKARQVSKLVLPKNFVIDYFTRDLETAPRYTETFYLSANVIHQRVLDGRFQDLEEQNIVLQPDATAQQTSPIQVAQDERQGIRRLAQDASTPFFTGEQYCWLDLDDDGYAEPYIVTFDLATGAVHRIVARFLPGDVKKLDGKIYEIAPLKVFTKYGFIPSPDGGFYDLGLGALLGPLNESVNTALNQIFDAATMATLGGGFLGRGFKSKSGAFTFQPNQWFPVDAPGDDLRKNVLPLPVRDPPQIMTWLIQFLVAYAERIVSATDLQMGENIGQNTPAETARTMDQNGARVYNSIYKRTWRAMREEFRHQAELNKLFFHADLDYARLTTGRDAMVRPDDYAAYGLSVRPAADPHIVSDTQRIQQTTTVLEASTKFPGFNRYQAGLRWLKAMQIPDIEQIYPQPMQQGPQGQMVPAQDFPPPGPDAKMLEVQIKAQAQKLKEAEFQQGMREGAIRLQMEIQESFAKTIELQAKATLETSQAKGADVDPAIKLIYAEIEAQGAKRGHLLDLLDIVTRNLGQPKEGEKGGNGAQMPALGAVTGMPVPMLPVGTVQ